jgi:uncharacterized BrkB/YihY/UPF0761 family membrane protein
MPLAALPSMRDFRDGQLPVVEQHMDDLRKELRANEILERAAALFYYLLLALIPALLFAVWTA